jgi:hypothetical protein
MEASPRGVVLNSARCLRPAKGTAADNEKDHENREKDNAGKQVNGLNELKHGSPPSKNLQGL